MRLNAETTPVGNAPVRYLVQVVGGAGIYSVKTFATDGANVTTERFLFSGIWTGAATIDFSIPMVFGAYCGMIRSPGSSHGEPLQRRAGVFWRDERA